MDYLQSLDVVIGEQVRMVKKEPYEGTITIETDGNQIGISHKAAEKLFVSRE